MRPLYGQGIFHLYLSGLISYIIIFDYDDPELEYYNLLRGEKELVENEIRNLKNNMQSFLDEEKMLINGKRVKPRVRDVWIEIRGEPRRPSVVFLIEIPFEPPSGNKILYEDYYEEEITEYDYMVHWIFPDCVKVLDYTIAGSIILKSGHLEIRVRKGTRTSDYESILLDISSCGGI